MAKINQVEYAILKNLNDEWKWIARDKNGNLYKFKAKPRKINDFSWNDRLETWSSMNDDNFQFIQWGDKAPYNIAELIEEYEKYKKASD